MGRCRERAAKCLASILAQKGIERAEVLVFDLASDAHPPLPGSDHPSVKIHQVADTELMSRLRADAAHTARGEIVAFVEDHTVVIPGWLDAIIDGMQAGHAGVGGEPGTLNPGVGISDAMTIMNYAFFIPTPTPRTYSMLPGHNSAYRRDLLLAFGDLLRPLITNEVLLGWKLIEQGHTLLLDPGAKFLHFNEETLGMIMRGYYYWNRCFGHNRALVFGWPWWRRLLQALAAPAIPPVRYVKYVAYLSRHDRPKLPVFMRYTGTFLCAQAAAATGMAIGALFGLADAELKFQYYEIMYDRDTIRP